MKRKALHKRAEDYRSVYIRKTGAQAARLGKSLCIRAEHHERISHIVHIIGQGNVTLYEYVDNVLNEHFKKYHEEMADSFNDKRIY